MSVHYCCKIWLESDDGEFVLGEGTAHLLQAIEDKGSLSAAASHIGISYAHAWRKLRDIERNLGKRVVERQRGGKKGGSSALTEEGVSLLKKYYQLTSAVEEVLQQFEEC